MGQRENRDLQEIPPGRSRPLLHLQHHKTELIGETNNLKLSRRPPQPQLCNCWSRRVQKAMVRKGGRKNRGTRRKQQRGSRGWVESWGTMEDINSNVNPMPKCRSWRSSWRSRTSSSTSTVPVELQAAALTGFLAAFAAIPCHHQEQLSAAGLAQTRPGPSSLG